MSMSVLGAQKRHKACRCVLAALAIFVLLSGYPASAGGKKISPGVEWVSYEKGLDAARRDGRFMVLDFYTSWCRDCKKMEAETFSEPEVARMLSEGFAAAKVDGEERPDLTSQYGVFAYPTVWLLAPDGTRIHQKIGYMHADEFKALLEYATSGAYKDRPFGEFARERSKRNKM